MAQESNLAFLSVYFLTFAEMKSLILLFVWSKNPMIKLEGEGKIAQSIKCLSLKDLNSELQHPGRKKMAVASSTCNSSMGEGETGACWLASLTNGQDPGLVTDSVSKNTLERDWERHQMLTSSFHEHVYTYACAHIENNNRKHYKE